LIEAEAVVQARENSERPFCFAPTEILKGELYVGEIDLLPDSSTRQMLARHPGRPLVLARTSGGGEKSRRRVGVADTDLGPIVREILDTAIIWKEEPLRRIACFAKLLNHKNPQIRTLAHLRSRRLETPGSRAED